MSTVISLSALRQMVHTGMVPQLAQIGSVVSDIWTDASTGRSYNMPFIVVDYRRVRLVNGKERMGVILLRKNATSQRIKYDDSGTPRFVASSLGRWANSEHGYLAGCSKELLDVVTPVLIDNEQVPVKFFLPSPVEMNLSVGIAEGSGQPWKYFRMKRWDGSFRDVHKEEQECWLRGQYVSEKFCYTWVLSTNGGVILHNVRAMNSCVLACVVA